MEFTDITLNPIQCTVMRCYCLSIYSQMHFTIVSMSNTMKTPKYESNCIRKSHKPHRQKITSTLIKILFFFFFVAPNRIRKISTYFTRTHTLNCDSLLFLLFNYFFFDVRSLLLGFTFIVYSRIQIEIHN